MDGVLLAVACVACRLSGQDVAESLEWSHPGVEFQGRPFPDSSPAAVRFLATNRLFCVVHYIGI
jgi:hypothetical protein